MARKPMKRPEYDGNACMLYDFMASQGLTEELRRRGYKVFKEV